MIDSFLSELNEENENNESGAEIDFSNQLQAFKEELKEIENNDNIINKLFIGFYETIYYCRKKKINIFSFQNYSFISFELEKIAKAFDTNKLSLELCFKYYYREKINSEFFCGKCNKLHKDIEYEKIYRPPKILLIILDRGHGKTFKDKVEINKYLDLKNIIDEKNYKYSSLYKLICVSTHSGSSSSSGHYTACCLADNNKFYYFSDTYAHEIDEDQIFNDEPYLLFYEQTDIKEQDKEEVEKIKKETKIIQINEKQKKNNNITPDNSSKYCGKEIVPKKEIEKEDKKEGINIRYKIKKIIPKKYINKKNERNNNNLNNIRMVNEEKVNRKEEEMKQRSVDNVKQGNSNKKTDNNNNNFYKIRFGKISFWDFFK